ncbi:DUF447 family protein [bacterium]|nr:DUF447 family protein [bacterium]
MILEGVVTTTNADGTTNISPMGPNVEDDFKAFQLRPFQTSRTYQNLKTTRCGVLHIVDDVMMIAQGAIKRWTLLPELVNAETVSGQRIANACQAFEFTSQVVEEDERTLIECQVVQKHQGRRFFGFNRAKHAVIEAAILATRINLLPMEDIQTQFEGLKIIVGKTGGAEEHAAFDLLNSYVGEFIP